MALSIDFRPRRRSVLTLIDSDNAATVPDSDARSARVDSRAAKTSEAISQKCGANRSLYLQKRTKVELQERNRKRLQKLEWF